MKVALINPFTSGEHQYLAQYYVVIENTETAETVLESTLKNTETVKDTEKDKFLPLTNQNKGYHIHKVWYLSQKQG